MTTRKAKAKEKEKATARATATARANAGISPLRQTIGPFGSGRDDNSIYQHETSLTSSTRNISCFDFGSIYSHGFDWARFLRVEAQLGLLVWRLRPKARASAGTSCVMQD